MRPETRDATNLCAQDLAEEREEAELCGQERAEECKDEAESIEEERPSALSKEETERLDEDIRSFQTEWPTKYGNGGGEEVLEWIEEGDALEFTIDRGDSKTLSNEKGIEGGEEEHCSLWSLLGVDDERVPERDPWVLGLGLESPDIQRWADEKGWAEVLRDAVAFDKG